MKNIKSVSPLELIQLKKLYEDGNSIYKIHLLTGRSMQCIKTHRDNNFEFKVHKKTSPVRYISLEEKHTIKKLHEEGMSIRNIAKTMGRNRSSIYDFIRRSSHNGEIVINRNEAIRRISVYDLYEKVNKLESQLNILTEFMRKQYG